MLFSLHQVVSAVNCARRGWVNVDMDTIACEACGARILFSTSSSWSQEQGLTCFYISIIVVSNAWTSFSFVTVH